MKLKVLVKPEDVGGFSVSIPGHARLLLIVPDDRRSDGQHPRGG